MSKKKKKKKVIECLTIFKKSVKYDSIIRKYEYLQITNGVDIYLQYQNNKLILTRISRA